MSGSPGGAGHLRQRIKPWGEDSLGVGVNSNSGISGVFAVGLVLL